jgi:3-dehydroquinate dehydratase
MSKPISYKIALQGITLSIIIFLIAVLIGLVSQLKQKKEEKEKIQAKLKVISDLYELKIDSIKTMHIIDSLAFNDSINKYKILANANLIITIKKDRDEVIGRISTADNDERDQLWATYSPKN